MDPPPVMQQQGYPPVPYPGPQPYQSPGGYPQEAAYPPPGVSQMMPPATYGMYPPPPMAGGAPGMSVGPNFGTGMATGALPATIVGSGLWPGPGPGGEDPYYAHAQQYGMSRGEVDGAMAGYRDLNAEMERGTMGSFGMGALQTLLQRVFGSAGNEQMVAVLLGTLGAALASGRMPSVKDFISMMGQYKLSSLGGQSIGGNFGGQQQPYCGGMGMMGTGYGQQPYGGGMGMMDPTGGLAPMMESLLHAGGEHGKHDKKQKKKKMKKKK